MLDRGLGLLLSARRLEMRGGVEVGGGANMLE